MARFQPLRKSSATPGGVFPLFPRPRLRISAPEGVQGKFDVARGTLWRGDAYLIEGVHELYRSFWGRVGVLAMEARDQLRVIGGFED